MKFQKILLLCILIIVYSPTSFAQKQQISCGVNDSILPDSIIKAMQMAPLWLKQKQARKAANDLYVCRMAIDIDSDTYAQFDKDTLLIKYEVLKIIERVSKIYEAEINTQLVVTHINIWKDSKIDPYKNISDIFQLLNIFSTNWTKNPFKSLPFDKAMYLSTKSFTGAGGVASGQFNVSPWGAEGTIAHELGHCFGSPHTQNCSWPGGLLDYCYSAEGSCYEEALERSKGTIMSYCRSGLTFHPLCQALMLNHAEKTFKKISKPEIPTFIPSFTNLNGKQYLLINPVLSAESYEYQVAQSEDFTKNFLIDSVKINALNYLNFKRNNTYYFKVRAKNRLGNSDWSNSISLTIPDTVLTVPVLKMPLHNVTNVNPSNDIALTFDKVEGATQYELGLAYYYDFAFNNTQNSNSTQISSTNSFTIKINKLGYGYKMLFWRVRAIKGNKKSPWSEPRRIILSLDENTLSLPVSDYNNAPTSFPLTFSKIDETYDTKITVSKNDNFSSPIIEKQIKTSDYYDYSYSSVNIENLLPNTQYFLKIEIINPRLDFSFDIPFGVIRTLTKTFKTGSTRGNLSNFSIFNKDNTPNFVNYLSEIYSNNKNIFISSSEGFVKMQLDSLKAKIFTRETTKGQLSLGFTTIDSLGNVWKIVSLSKRKTFNGAFPVPVYAIRQFDGGTMKLISSQEEIQLDSLMNGINAYYPNNKIVGYGGIFAKLEGNIAKTFLTFNDYYEQVEVSKNYMWFKAYNLVKQQWEVKRYSLKTKETIIIPKAPVVSSDPNYYVFSNMKIDQDENLWISPNNGGIAKYDGKNWTVFNYLNSPLNFTISIGIDKFNNIYTTSIKNSAYSIFKYNGTDFKEMATLFPKADFSSTLTIDGLGKIWVRSNNSTLLRYDPCSQIAKPSFSNTNAVLNYGKSTTLEAKGCNNVVWNWKNKEENIYEKLISGTNKLNVSPKSNTLYSARCYDDGCSGEETPINVAIIPNLFSNKIDKIQYCVNDTIKITPKIEGSFDDNNIISGILTSTQGGFTVPLINYKTNYSFALNPKIAVGKYWLKLQGTSPKVVSKDSIEITILPIPSVSISGANNVCVGQSIVLTANTNSTQTIAYQWKKDNVKVGIANTLNASTAGQYSLVITDANGCINATSSYAVVQNPLPIATVTGENTFCKGKNTVLNGIAREGMPPYTYQWKQDTTKIGTNTGSLIVNSEGQYKVLVTDSKGCFISSATYSVIQIEYPIINLTKSGSTNIFQNTNITLSITVIAGQNIQWNRDGVAIAGAINNSYAATQAGTYTVSVSTNGCTTVSEIVTVNLITSNEPNTLDNIGLKVFSNPNDGTFTVEFNSTDLKPTELIISDILGREVLRKTIKIVGKHSQQINISEQPTGQYLITIYKDNFSKTLKITKN